MPIEKQRKITPGSFQHTNDVILKLSNFCTTPRPSWITKTPHINHQHLELIFGKEISNRMKSCRMLPKPMNNTNSIFGIGWSIACMIEPNLFNLGLYIVFDYCIILSFKVPNKIFLNKHPIILINLYTIIYYLMYVFYGYQFNIVVFVPICNIDRLYSLF